ncbi:DUF6368 family protein [Ktedonobacter racemifer]|uniref:Uncharacterized protein n=1 Tax=Ktedonobacter racemifer DSM 44963 TaxID=485913 RepID=D6U042_KTERA|nr:DUF6368 family protein [Ktedonobacter racemifer]EFH82182.1 hypothetical protein Krac_2969 [Ktedonobacter racemifer DSM 44963]
MAGPVATVVFREKLTDSQMQTIDHWLLSISVVAEGSIGDRRVWIPGTAFGYPESEGHPFLVTLPDLEPHPDQELLYYEDEQEEVRSVLGYLPTHGVRLIAMVSGRISHCLLGHLSWHLAKEYGGLIDMEGTITGPFLPKLISCDNAPDLEEIRALLSSFPGQVWEIFSEIEPEKLAPLPHHIVDPTFLEAWLKDPHFHMIK